MGVGRPCLAARVDDKGSRLTALITGLKPAELKHHLRLGTNASIEAESNNTVFSKPIICTYMC